MSRGTARLFHLAVAVLGSTGAALLWLVYLAAPAEAPPGEEFSVVGNPWQPLVTAAHILAGPALVFLVGLVWSRHVWAKIRAKATSRRPTGIVLAALFPLLVVSGYALQTTGSERLRTALGWTHAGIGIAFAITYAVHQFTRPPRRAAAADSPRE